MRKIGKGAARILLAIILIAMIGISWKTDWYSLALSALSRGADITSFSRWYIGPAVYLSALAASVAVIFLVMNAIPDECRWMEKQGSDTMPLYLSHLILFMAVGFLIKKNNWAVTVTVSAAFAIFSVVLFSMEWYRSVFNKTIGKMKKIIMREE